MGRLRDAIEVSTSSEEAHHILQHLRIHISSCVSRLGPCVWGHTHVVEGAERGVGVVLVLEDVQPCRCDVARLKCLHEGLFVDDGTTVGSLLVFTAPSCQEIVLGAKGTATITSGSLPPLAAAR